MNHLDELTEAMMGKHALKMIEDGFTNREIQLTIDMCKRMAKTYSKHANNDLRKVDKDIIAGLMFDCVTIGVEMSTEYVYEKLSKENQ